MPSALATFATHLRAFPGLSLAGASCNGDLQARAASGYGVLPGLELRRSAPPLGFLRPADRKCGCRGGSRATPCPCPGPARPVSRPAERGLRTPGAERPSWSRPLRSLVGTCRSEGVAPYL